MVIQGHFGRQMALQRSRNGFSGDRLFDGQNDLGLLWIMVYDINMKNHQHEIVRRLQSSTYLGNTFGRKSFPHLGTDQNLWNVS